MPPFRPSYHPPATVVMRAVIANLDRLMQGKLDRHAHADRLATAMEKLDAMLLNSDNYPRLTTAEIRRLLQLLAFKLQELQPVEEKPWKEGHSMFANMLVPEDRVRMAVYILEAAVMRNVPLMRTFLAQLYGFTANETKQRALRSHSRNLAG